MLQEILLYIHLVGFALGFGGALVSDAMFFSSVRDKIISKSEIRFMELGGRVVWAGLAVLTLSGIGLFLVDPVRLLASSKFVVKMAIVGIIACNGVVFHRLHLRHMKQYLGTSLHLSEGFRQKSIWIVMSGAVSVCSWFAAALLGSLPGVPLSVGQLFGLYFLCLSIACLSAILLHAVLFGRAKK